MPCSTNAIAVSAVSPLVALAVPNWVSAVLAIPYARSANPNAWTIPGIPHRSTRTAPEKPTA